MRFLRSFILKPTERVFMWQSVEVLNDFNPLTLKLVFWKTKTFFKKSEYPFLVDSTKIESASFLHKTSISEANVKTDEWWVQNGPITKNGFLSVTILFSWKFCFTSRTSYKELIWCNNDLNAHIPTFCKRWSFIWQFFFPVSILKHFCYFTRTCRFLTWILNALSFLRRFSKEENLS